MLNILIVDDNPLIRMGIRNMIPWDKYHAHLVGSAEDGEEAVNIIKSDKPDLVITDIKMPGEDGVYLLGQIRQKWPDISTIVVSAYDEFDYVKEALKTGSIDYILKPIDPIDLRNAIEKVINEKSPREIVGEDGHCGLPKTVAAVKLARPMSLCEFCAIFSDVQNAEFYKVNDTVYRIEMFSTTSSDYINSIIGKKMNKEMYALGVSNIENEKENLRFAWERACGNIMDNLPYKTDLVIENNTTNDMRIDNIKLLCSAGDKEKIKVICNNALYANRKNEGFTYSSLCSAINNCLFQMTPIDQDDIYTVRKFEDRVDNAKLTLIYMSLESIICDLNKVIDSICDKYCRINGNKINLIQRVKVLIDKHYMSNLSLSSISSLFYVSPAYLSRIFRQKTGVTLTSYLTDVRLEKASFLLESTSRNVTEIANDVGFDDPNYFTRVYKKKYFVSPMDRRKQSNI